MNRARTAKPQADRLLKQLPLRDRKLQQELRRMIAQDPQCGASKPRS